MRYFLLLLTAILFQACQKEMPSVQIIVDQAIAYSCGSGCEASEVSFDFRDKHYSRTRRGGLFTYRRSFEDSLGQIRDELSNEGFKRYVNDSLVVVVDSMANKYANSVNSVHYFSQLPYGLNDPATIKELRGVVQINGKAYYEVLVWFRQEGGGKDYDDQFLYWFDTDDLRLDYFAYSYLTDGGGVRFREAYNPRSISGYRVVDYKNYKPADKETPLEELPVLFERGELELLSTIENKNVQVRLLD